MGVDERMELRLGYRGEHLVAVVYIILSVTGPVPCSAEVSRVRTKALRAGYDIQEFLHRT